MGGTVMGENKKIAIVTGGASGIGRAICNELSSQNVFVVIADINERDGKAFEEKLNQDVLNSRFTYLDVTDYNCVEHVIKGIYEEFGRLDYLFNNAGISMYGELYVVRKLERNC